MILMGANGLYYSLVIYPAHVPGFGGGERFLLHLGNNYTNFIYIAPGSKLHMEVSGNSSFELRIDNSAVGVGDKFSLSLEPGEHLVIVRSSEDVSGSLELRQEPDITTAATAALVVALGATGIATILKRT